MGNSEEKSESKTKIWNVPNIMTTVRVILIIPFVLALLGATHGWYGENNFFTACIVADAIFIIASLTDLFDGKIARKYNLVTNFGKFMDPLADKVLVCSGLICLVEMGRVPAWIVIIIIAREFIISGFRLVASDAGIVIAASYWGKWKTTLQMTLVIMAILDLSPYIPFYGILMTVVMYLALILTVISLVDYIYKNRKVLTR
ncbi:MAG: CDP-diacylglycerol--glycerol-3-phosphate 3-phosphatidyltransferase [Lachnospiraceae bacterium]|nr:CDP-diacylglycerol--glycerol-3-phosphate 3-phosphatidyltransferase [Lachnospiraceae bacterium]MBQ8139703.1 CDP-diacylglycerol--glycerol-3-phosphate 3-phosphatidyltransferase [Lachnospiraceae bacterium]MBR1650389.1 CDP-diacylglycerol--glycerol-3-phosphate 3-phosphatidyltransferase [Lachnospiraceae bacterium]